LTLPEGKYVAVTVDVPCISVEVVRVATPSDKFAIPKLALGVEKTTTPLELPLDCGETVAVNVTGCPTLEGFAEEVRATVLGAGFTT